MSDNEKTENLDVNETAAGTETVEKHDHDHDHDHGHHHHHDNEEEESFKFEQDPVFDVEYKGECEYEVKVTVPAVNFKVQSEKILTELKEEAMIPGFRKGKVPVKLVQNKFGKMVRADAAQKLVEESFKKLVADKDLKPIRMPEVEGLEEKAAQLGETEDLAFSLNFEVSPRCELGQYRGIEVERPIVKIEDKDIDEVIERMRERMAVYETVEEAATSGDQVLIDFEGKIDGEAFQGNSAENYPYIMGSARFLAEFEAALDGKKTGETAEADVTFPADWRNTELANKTARFTIKINEVKRRKLAEINDELAKQVGQESLEAWRKQIEEQLRQDTASHSDSYARNNALDKIIEISTFEVPKSLLESMGNSGYESLLRQAHQNHTHISTDEQHAELREQGRKNAMREIQEWVLLREIADVEGIELTDEDFEQEASSMAANYGVEKEAMLAFLMGDEQRSRTEMNLLHKKVFDVVLANATIIEKELKDEDSKEEEAAS